MSKTVLIAFCLLSRLSFGQNGNSMGISSGLTFGPRCNLVSVIDSIFCARNPSDTNTYCEWPHNDGFFIHNDTVKSKCKIKWVFTTSWADSLLPLVKEKKIVYVLIGSGEPNMANRTYRYTFGFNIGTYNKKRDQINWKQEYNYTTIHFKINKANKWEVVNVESKAKQE